MTTRNIDYDPMNDVLFKFIFGANERKHITIGFLNAVLNREGKNAIKEIEFRNVEFVPQRDDEKLSRIDIFAVIDNNERVDIEVQCVNYHNMAKRSLFYWAHIFLHNQSLLTSQDYKALKPAIAINVLNFNFLSCEKACSMYTLRDEENFHKLTDAIELYFLEVPKLIKKPVQSMNNLERWLAFLSRKWSKKEKEELAMQDPLIQDAMNEIDKFFMDDAAYMSYINRQAAILDYNSGMNASREEGLKKGLKEGLKEGLEKGLEKGEDKLSRLFLALSNAGRQNEFAQACSDKTLREKLYKEFNIE